MDLIIIILVFYFIYKKFIIGNSNLAMFNKVAIKQGFSNIRNLPSISTKYNLISADAKGENFLFAIKIGPSEISNNDIIAIYERAKKIHIHNVILVTDYINNSNIIKQLSSYNIEVWDRNKMLLLLRDVTEITRTTVNTQSNNILHTSNASDDKCEIEPPFDPIKDGRTEAHSILGSLFNKPNKL